MTTAAAVINILLGIIYLSYGLMTASEMARDRRTLGVSHFGMAWLAMCLTCGPHHLTHGIHLGFEGRSAGVLDLVVVLVGLPAGLVWFTLRLEAFLGGRGDRLIPGMPFWVAALPTVAAVYATVLAATVLNQGLGSLNAGPEVWANVALVVLYSGVGYYLVRTQITNRRSLGGWSASGLALSVTFPTCALMHGVYALYMASGQYESDIHNHWIDILAVPAAIYFLWVVRSLHRGTFLDWNGVPGGTDSPVRAEGAPA